MYASNGTRALIQPWGCREGVESARKRQNWFWRGERSSDPPRAGRPRDVIVLIVATAQRPSGQRVTKPRKPRRGPQALQALGCTRLQGRRGRWMAEAAPKRLIPLLRGLPNYGVGELVECVRHSPK